MDIDGSYFDSDPGTTSNTSAPDTSASGGSDPFDYSSFYDQYQYAGVTPDTGLAELGVSTPAYGRSGMDFNQALDALIGMQAYPYIPPEPSLNIAGIRGIPSAGMLAEDPVYGFREPVTAHPVDRPTGFSDLYSLPEYDYPASVAPGGTRSLASVVAGTPPTQSSTFDRPVYGDSTLSYREVLNGLSRAGYGAKEGANPNNPTQTVEQMIAANNVSNFLEKYAPTIFGAATGFGPHLNAIRMGADVLSGKTTPGQALTGLAAGLIGAKTGIPAGVLEGIFTNNPGQIAGAGAQAGLGALVNALTKNPVARAMADVTLGSELNRNVSEAVGGSSKKGGGLPEVLDSGLSGFSKLFSGTGTPSQRSATTDNTYSAAGNNADTYAVTSAIDKAAEKAVPEYKPPIQKREMVAGRYGPIMSYAVGA